MPPYTYENATTIETQREAAFRRTAMFDYWLHIIGAIFSLGLLSLVDLIINYIQRPSSRGSSGSASSARWASSPSGCCRSWRSFPSSGSCTG